MDWKEIGQIFKISYDVNKMIQDDIVDKIYVKKRQIENQRVGWEASCYLSRNLNIGASRSFLYGNSNGMGSSKYKNIAISKSISESLERWAFYYLIKNSPEKFKIVPNSSGFAASPFSCAGMAEINSIAEGYERWCLIELNCGRLELKKNECGNETHFIHYSNELKLFFTLVVEKISDHYCYGFSADSHLKVSLSRSKIEKTRNYFTLNNNFRCDLSKIPIGEKRLMYFSTYEGYKHFCSLLNARARTRVPTILESEIVSGPWSTYSVVWRTIFDIDPLVHDKDLKIFYF